MYIADDTITKCKMKNYLINGDSIYNEYVINSNGMTRLLLANKKEKKLLRGMEKDRSDKLIVLMF